MPRSVGMRKTFFVYLMASRFGVLYVGVTNDIVRRVGEHKSGTSGGFTGRYRVTRLVHVEEFDDSLDAIAREKQVKGWTRKRELDLVRSSNPKWRNLSETWLV